MRKSKTFRPDRIGSYFRMEWLSLALVTASVIYNVGLLATPWFEGRLAQCLADILGGSETAARSVTLSLKPPAPRGIVRTHKPNRRAQGGIK